MNLVITLDETPQEFRLFCAEGDNARGVHLAGSSMNLNYGVGGSLRLSTSPSGKSGDWTYFHLLGKSLAWTVDLSNVPCGMNATFYSVLLSQGNGYRDACATFPSTTEMDFMEANQYAWHTTLHRKSGDCGSAPPVGVGGTISDSRYLFYDFSGHQTQSSLLYGPGTTYTINTLLPFQAKMDFILNSNNSSTGDLVSVVITLSQDGNTIGQQFHVGNEEYKGWLAAIGKEIGVVDDSQGNVLVWSLWTGNLNWLESPPCGRGASPRCTDTSCQFTISEISLTTINV
jgi:hypothetical protein